MKSIFLKIAAYFLSFDEQLVFKNQKYVSVLRKVFAVISFDLKR